MNTPGKAPLPRNKKLWRVRIRLENGAGECRWYESVPLTESEATAELLEYANGKVEAEKYPDRMLIDAYYAACKARRDTKRAAK